MLRFKAWQRSRAFVSAAPRLWPCRCFDVLPAVLACLAGTLQAASLAWPWDALTGLGLARGQPLWWLQWLALAALVLLLQAARSARQAAWRGWLFGLGWLAGTFSWLFTSMHSYGGLPAALAVLALLALAAALALYYAAACGCFWALAARHAAWGVTSFAALWLLAELARGVVLTGFGWGAIGYAQVDGPLAVLIGWVGLYGVSAVAAGFAAALAAALRASFMGRWQRAVLHLFGMAALGVLVQWVSMPLGQSTGTLSVTLLQGNIAQQEKFQAATGVPQALRWYGEQLQANRSALIITPETALALLPDQLPPGYWQALQQRFAGGDQAALVGLPLGSLAAGYTNSVVGFKPGQLQPWRYDKHHLVPFGEFIPPLFRWFTELMQIPLGDFNRGSLPQPTFDWQGQRLAATICYENLFSEELAVQFAKPALAPTMLVNVSNLGWFGEHLAMDQHLQIARLRALEFSRPFLLATNTGQSAIVDHRGRVTQHAAPHTATALTGAVEGRSGITPYAAWAARFGLWPLLGVALTLLAAGALARRHPAAHW